MKYPQVLWRGFVKAKRISQLLFKYSLDEKSEPVEFVSDLCLLDKFLRFQATVTTEMCKTFFAAKMPLNELYVLLCTTPLEGKGAPPSGLRLEFNVRENLSINF